MFYLAYETAFPTWLSAHDHNVPRALCVCLLVTGPAPHPHLLTPWGCCVEALCSLGLPASCDQGWHHTGKVYSDLPVSGPPGSCGRRCGLRAQLVCLIMQPMWEAGGHPRCGQRSILGGPRDERRPMLADRGGQTS